MNKIKPAAGLLAAAERSRATGSVPSLFIDEFWANKPEHLFELWLYSRGFRPCHDNFLGKTKTQTGIDADTFNEYYRDEKHGFLSHNRLFKHSWSWGHAAGFASQIGKIKLIQFNIRQQVDSQQAVTEKRKEVLIKLHEEYETSLNTTGRDDYELMLSGDEPIHKWCVVSQAADTYYLTTYEERKYATDAAAENAVDQTYADIPVLLVDLDTNEQWSPEVTTHIEWSNE